MQSSDEDIADIKEIKVLVSRDNVPERMCTMDVPLETNEYDIVKTIFSDMEVIKDDLWYKVVNDNTEQWIQVTKVSNTPERPYDYLVDVQSMEVQTQKSNNFSDLLNSEKFSDVTLSVGDKVIHAHKNILANRSPVFDAMFTHKMQESQSSQVEIKELNYETVYDFLHYLYAGTFKNCYTKNVFARYSNLLGAANRYCVESLKGQCEEKLMTVLTIHNVLECLVLADLHNAINLKKKVKDFIVDKSDQITELPSFKSFLLMHPDLSIEIVHALIVEKNNLKSALEKQKSRKIRS